MKSKKNLHEKEDRRPRSQSSRWCEKHGYFIDLAACEARADIRPSCRRCVARWQQLCFPFMD